MSTDLADEQREQEIRERYPVAANPYGRMAIRDLLRLLDAEREKVARMRTVPADLRIVGTWLVEEVGHHTCGTGPGGHYGAHEPGCGQEPIVNLATVPGFADLTGEAPMPSDMRDNEGAGQAAPA